MIIIGERINSTRKSIKEALDRKSADFLLNEAGVQINAGAAYLDVNTATMMEKEIESMKWLVTTIQAKFDIPLCIDSPDPACIEAGLSVHKGKALVNSITAEKGRSKEILPLVKRYGSLVIGLTIDENGMPITADERFDIVKRIISDIKGAGISEKDLYIDPLVRPVSSEQAQALQMLEAMRMIKTSTEANIVVGLSNISFGLPNRALLNATFLSMAMCYGLDAAIIDPTDTQIHATLKASEAILNSDQYCMRYIKASREGKI
ncbi:MAG: hypothetical protein AUJ75_00165 [Candidatus Omnitrophica bacterium CG1_02_49_10]|nr:MAG: hypothetical protein AUJ75_00165 [Candidatus Omnitrophica bacterium CG1_02_49_10]